MMKKMIFLLIGLILLVGCAPIDTDEVCSIYKDLSEQRLNSIDEYSKELADWKINGIKRQNLYIEASKECVLMITEGKEPTPLVYGYGRITELRTLNGDTDQIIGRFDDGTENWKYWLACQDVFY